MVKKEASPSSPWLSSPAVDLLVGCGAWSLPLIGITLYLSSAYHVAVSLAFYALALFCNNPHYMATLYRAYGVKRDVSRYKFFSIYITAIIALSGLAAHISPDLAPWLFTIYLVWSPWHYTGQNFGIAVMMLRRSNTVPVRWERNALYLSYIGSFVVWVAQLNTDKAQDGMTITLGIPIEIASLTSLFGYLLFAVAGGAAFIGLARRAALKALIAPLVLHLSQFLWFLLPGLLRGIAGQEYHATYFSAGILAIMHCAQYLWITNYYARREVEQGLRGPQRNWRPLAHYLALVFGGIALFVPGPWIVSKAFGRDLFESALIFISLVNIHHFLLDGAIWKLRDGPIARLLLGTNSKDDDAPLAADGNAPPDWIGWLFGKSNAARAARFAAAALLIAFALADQTQNAFTLRGAEQRYVEFARLLNPNDSRVPFRSAHNALARGDESAALAELQRALDLNPRNLAALHLLAQRRLLASQADEAAALYRRILDIASNDVSALLNYSLILISQGQSEAARPHLERALSIDPNRWQPRYHLAKVDFASGYFDQAAEGYEIALHLAPDSEVRRSIIADLAACYERLGESDKANALRNALSDL